MTVRRLLAFSLFAATSLSLFTGEAGNIFFWQGRDKWKSWDDPANWSISGTEKTNPDNLVPGSAADDKVNYSGYTYSGDYGTFGYLDLGGNDYTIAALTRDGLEKYTTWKSYKFHLTNGTLRITAPETRDNLGYGFELYDGAKLLFGTNGLPSYIYRTSGMYSYWNVRSGARMEVRGKEVQLADISSTISAGGVLVFDPDKFCFHNSSGARVSKIDNSGTLIAPRGLVWNGADIYTTAGRQKSLYVNQKTGSTTYLGGDFAKTTEESPNSDGRACIFKFTMEGGTLVTSNRVQFANRTQRYGTETLAEMTGSATVRTEEGSVLDMGIFTYGEDVTLTKDGPGTLSLPSLPPNLAVQAGTVVFANAVADLSAASFADGTKIVFGTTGNSFDPPGNYANLDFALAAEGFGMDSENLLTSTDPDFLAYVKGKIDPGVPAGFATKVEGNVLKLTADAAATLYWRAAPKVWNSWNDPANWSILKGSNFNPAGVVPGLNGAANPIWAYTTTARTSDYDDYYGKFDLNGGSYDLSGYSGGGSAGGTWHCSQFHLTNGTLSVAATRMPGTSVTFGYTVWNGATLNYAGMGTGLDYIGRSGLYETWTVKSGGRLNVDGGLFVLELKATVEAGGALRWSDGKFAVKQEMAAGKPFTINNSGTVELPFGLDWTSGDAKSSGNKVFTFNQKAGTVLFGGDFKKTAEEAADASHGATMSFVFSGGRLVATNSVAFANPTVRFGRETFASVADGANVSVGVLGADSVLDMRLFTCGSGASVTKDGEGLLVVGDLPSALAVTAGAIEFGATVTDLSGATFADGTRIVLGAKDNAFSAPANYRACTFELDTEAFAAGNVVLTSENGDFLAYVKDQIAATLPPETKAEIAAGTLKLVADSAFVFRGEGEFDIDDPAHWSGGVVPGNVDVIVSGAETVARVSANSPKFKSITLLDGATLKATDGSDLSAVVLAYPSKLTVPEGASVSLTNGVAATGDASGLPIIEVATNATLTAAAGTVFKNVDIRLYGTMTTSGEGALTFGGAAAGETTYFAMTAIGGTVRTIGYAGTSVASAYRRIVVAEEGGTVVVTRPILFRDCTFDLVSATGAQGFAGTLIGYQNSVLYPFEVVFDHTTIRMNRANLFGGAALIRIVNGSQVRIGTSHPGVATFMEIADAAEISVEGSGSRLLLENADPFRNKFGPDVYGTRMLTVKDGGLVAAHNTTGITRAYVQVEDGVWGVPNLPFLSLDLNPHPADNDVRNWMTDLFNGFYRVNVAGGRSLVISSVDVLGADKGYCPKEWDRDVKLANIPLTGAGDVVISNGVPGHAMAVTVVHGANTCSGRISTDRSSSDSTALRFADGANWAGTVVAGDDVSLTNLTDATAPAEVSFGALVLNGKMPLRVWKDGACDTLNIGSALSGTGSFAPVFMDGRPDNDVTYVLGRYPKSAGVPDARFVKRNWTFSAEPIPGSDEVTLKLTFHRTGLILTVR